MGLGFRLIADLAVVFFTLFPLRRLVGFVSLGFGVGFSLGRLHLLRGRGGRVKGQGLGLSVGVRVGVRVRLGLRVESQGLG